MGKIEIKDLPKDVKITKEEMKKMRGGGLVSLGLTIDPRMYSSNCNCVQSCQSCVGFTCQACQSCTTFQGGQNCYSCGPQ